MVTVVVAGNDFVYGNLRVDLSAIYGAGDYRVTLLANDKPNGGSPDYTTAWLGLNLAQYNGQPFSGIGFQEWPASGGSHDSIIYVTDINGQNTFCPAHYGVDPNWAGDEHAWYAGTNGKRCFWLLFPSVHVYMPATLKDYH